MDESLLDRERSLEEALHGRRVLVTRAGAPGVAFAQRLESLGVNAIHCPAIALIAPENYSDIDTAVKQLDHYAWILFASASAVDAFAERVRAVRGCEGARLPKLGVVGQATANALTAHGWNPDFTSRGRSGAALAHEVPIRSAERVLIPRSDIALPDLPNGLRERGIDVHDVIAYRTVADPLVDRAAALLSDAGMDAITFTSPSTVEYFVDAVSRSGANAGELCRIHGIAVICIGATTAASAARHGLAPNGVSIAPSMEGMIDALAGCLGPVASAGGEGSDSPADHPVRSGGSVLPDSQLSFT